MNDREGLMRGETYHRSRLEKRPGTTVPFRTPEPAKIIP
jgi:hypothetical protein